MFAVEWFGLSRVSKSQRVGLDRDTDVPLFLVMDKSVFQKVGDECFRQCLVHRYRQPALFLQ